MTIISPPPLIANPTTFQSDGHRVYAVVRGTKYWITSPRIFELAGLSFNFVKPGLALNRTQTGPDLVSLRQLLSIVHLVGNGIEIGALHCPALVSPAATVRYVDYLPADALRLRYPDIPFTPKVDIVDDGETLTSVPDHSIDFLIANHMLEHTENPLGVLQRHLIKLRSGGILFYALPDKRFTFDSRRPITPFEHLVTDYLHGPDNSRQSHFLEFVRLVDGVTERAAIETHVRTLQAMDNRIHFHVWDYAATTELFIRAPEIIGITFEVVTIVHDDAGPSRENIVILKKN